AYHVAVRSQTNSARQRVHERRAVTMSSADPMLDLSLREMRSILFEELYHPLYMNPTLARKMGGIWNPHSETTTGADGSYPLTVFQGPGAIGVVAAKQDAYMPAWLTLKERKDFFKVALFQDNDENYLSVAVGENLAGIGIAQLSYNALVLLEPGDKE